MKFEFENRASDSPLVEWIWRTQTEGSGTFISTAASNSELVVAKVNGATHFAIRGPETFASKADFAADGEFFGIVFRLGAFMPKFPASDLMNRNEVILPETTNNSFRLDGSSWEFPTFDNADTFINRLVREGLLVTEPVVQEALTGGLNGISIRSVQRRFVRATGLTHGVVYQIERARRALALLEQGVSIADTVDIAGYADQPHLTRSLKRFMGQTPGSVAPTNTAR